MYPSIQLGPTEFVVCWCRHPHQGPLLPVCVYVWEQGFYHGQYIGADYWEQYSGSECVYNTEVILDLFQRMTPGMTLVQDPPPPKWKCALKSCATFRAPKFTVLWNLWFLRWVSFLGCVMVGPHVTYSKKKNGVLMSPRSKRLPSVTLGLLPVACC